MPIRILMRLVSMPARVRVLYNPFYLSNIDLKRESELVLPLTIPCQISYRIISMLFRQSCGIVIFVLRPWSQRNIIEAT